MAPNIVIMICCLIFAALLLLLWGVSVVSFLCLIAYLCVSSYLAWHLSVPPFHCLLSDEGDIKVGQEKPVIGVISDRSFFNRWVIFLCIDIDPPFVMTPRRQSNNKRQWFVVFNSCLAEHEYRLLTRLIGRAHYD